MMLGAKPDGKKPKGETGVSVFFMVGMLDVGMGLGWGFHRRVGLGYSIFSSLCKYFKVEVGVFFIFWRLELLEAACLSTQNPLML